MDRRLSNVQQLRRESATSRGSRASYDSGYSRVTSDGRQSKIVKHQPRSRSSADESQRDSIKTRSRTHSAYSDNQWQEKRRRPTFWETVAGLVCSLGALASRAAKVATRRADYI
uniref:Uncharacterized protein n=1 Tax=Bracon brevicornis TaxID=1563983 RepID=A0A6V7HNK6_9HYME